MVFFSPLVVLAFNHAKVLLFLLYIKFLVSLFLQLYAQTFASILFIYKSNHRLMVYRNYLTLH